MTAGIKPPPGLRGQLPPCPICGQPPTSVSEETVPVVRRLCDPKDKELEPGVWRRYEPCGHVVGVGVSEADLHASMSRGLAQAYAGQAAVRDDLISDDALGLDYEVVLRIITTDADPAAALANFVAQEKEAALWTLTSESALAAFREAWHEADAAGAEGDRVRRGMAAAVKSVSS